MVVVYFDYGSTSELVAILDDESIYKMISFRLKLAAKSAGAELSESVITDSDECQRILYDHKLEQIKKLERD